MIARAVFVGACFALAGAFLSTPPTQKVDVDAMAPAVPPLSSDCKTAIRVIFQRADELSERDRELVGRVVCEEARRAGYDARWVLAVMEVESSFDAGAVSPVGARGLMQLMDPTAAYLAEREGLALNSRHVSKNLEWNVRLGVRYLADLHARFQDLDMALMAYNAGPTKVRELRLSGGLTPYRVYPAKVRRAFDRFQKEDHARREALSLSL